MKKSILIIVLSLVISTLVAQKPKDFQVQFEEAKKLYGNLDYQKSFDAFKMLSIPHKNNKYVEISHYYTGLSAFKMGRFLDTRYILGKLENEYSNWKGIDEARYLKLNSYLEEKIYLDALSTLGRIEKNKLLKEAESMFEFYVEKDSLLNLDSLQQNNPDNIFLAELCLRQLSKQGNYTDADKLLAMYLIQDYELDESILKQMSVHTEMKEEYNVALMVPLFLTNEVGSRKYYRFYEMVQGAEIAVNNLKEKGIKINLFVFDTEKSSSKVSELLKKDEMKLMDLLIGPVYPNPSTLAMDFAMNNGIPCLSPRLDNEGLVKGNRYGYKWLPSKFNIAHNIYEYAKDSTKPGKVIVFYSDNPEDSILANTYATLISQNDSMTVEKVMVAGDGIKKISKKLYYGPLDDQNLEKKAQLSHIVLATEENIVSAELIGVLEANDINVPVFASENSLKINLISPDQFYRRNFIFYAPDYNSKRKSEDFDNAIIDRLNLLPSIKYIHGYLGYDLLMVLGQELNENGTVLYDNTKQATIYPGLLTSFAFSQDHTNKYVPLIKFNEQLNFNLINSEVYE